MDGAEFDALMQWQPFGSSDTARVEGQFRRRGALAAALWGTTPGDLQRQLLGRYPEIPSGFDLADFRALLQSTQMMAERSRDPRQAWLSRLSFFNSHAILVGTQCFTAWEARCEIVRRAVEYLEGR